MRGGLFCVIPKIPHSLFMKRTEKFRVNVESFYDLEAIEKSCIEVRDRDGRYKSFPIMTVSAAILELPANFNRIYSTEEIGNIMAELKKDAKHSADNIRVSSLIHFETNHADKKDWNNHKPTYINNMDKAGKRRAAT